MLMRLRRNPKALGVVAGAAVVSLCLVALGVWWSGVDDRTPLPHQHGQASVNGMNVSAFVDGPRKLILEPRKVLDACTSGQETNGGVEVLVIVPSSPHNLAARSAVRESWAAYLPANWALMFYVGGVDRPSVQERLSAESHAHRDIAQDTTFSDSYSNLTLKTLALLSWANRTCPGATFVFKVDDDVYVNIPKLRHLAKCLGSAMRDVYVEKRGKQENVDTRGDDGDCDGVRELVSYYTDAETHRYVPYVIAGYLYRDIKPYRDPTAKWHVPKTAYAKDVLPPFLSGTAYLVSGNVLRHLLEGARTTPAIALEDVYLTGLVASEKLKLRLGKLEGVERFRPRFQGVCTYKTTLTAHGFAPDELRDVTHRALGVSDVACDGVFTRVGLALNRIITSIFPRLPTSLGLDDEDVRAMI